MQHEQRLHVLLARNVCMGLHVLQPQPAACTSYEATRPLHTNCICTTLYTKLPLLFWATHDWKIKPWPHPLLPHSFPYSSDNPHHMTCTTGRQQAKDGWPCTRTSSLTQRPKAFKALTDSGVMGHPTQQASSGGSTAAADITQYDVACNLTATCSSCPMTTTSQHQQDDLVTQSAATKLHQRI